MKELIFAIVIIALGFMLMADTTITLKPFSIKFGSPFNAVGYFLIFTGIICIKIDAEKKGATKAINRVFEQIEQLSTKDENK